jgi:hypothetical protein
MKRILLSGVAIFASATALVGLGSAGQATAVEVSGGIPWSAGVFYHVENGVVLGAPVVNSKNENLSLLVDVGGKGAGYRLGGVGPTPSAADVKWPILDRSTGSPTGYWVNAKIGITSFLDAHWKWECNVWSERAGESSSGPYQCDLVGRGTDLDWDLHLTDDRVQRRLEASGSVRTDGSVSLETANGLRFGGYQTESTVRVDGADIVPATGAATQFGAVVTSTDKPKEQDTARMTFFYAIHDASAPGDGRRYYVHGNVSNHEGRAYKGGSFCDITDYLGNVVHDSGYTCTMDSYYGGAVNTSGRAQYITDFTVGTKR